MEGVRKVGRSYRREGLNWPTRLTSTSFDETTFFRFDFANK